MNMKLGILGAGHIAKSMAVTVNGMEHVTLYAVGARELARAVAFQKKYQVQKAYGSYEELVQDPEIDLIYVATPHSHHYEHVKLCLEHGKNVLCEKALTVNAGQAEELFRLAKEKNLLLTEAIWTRYMPLRKTLDEVLLSGVIGNVHGISANLCYVLNHLERNQKPELAGGALLDLGVYTLNFACMIMKQEIVKIQAEAVMNEYGVDDVDHILLSFKDGTTAMLHSSQLVSSERGGYIYGDQGYIVADNINNCQGFRVYSKDHGLLKEYKAPAQITGYEYEVEACRQALMEGRLECPEMPHSESIRMMKLMDSIRKIWGMKYPMEES